MEGKTRTELEIKKIVKRVMKETMANHVKEWTEQGY
jgi:hypothetical protein